MKATALIPVTATVAICGGILIAQSIRNRGLDTRVTGLRVAARSSSTTDSAANNDRSASSSTPQRTASGSKASPPGSPESKLRVERCARNLARKVSALGDTRSSPAAFFRVLPTVLQSVSHLTVAELLEVADKMTTAGPLFPPQDANAAARMMLYLLAAEHEPLEILERTDLGLESSEGGLQKSIFGILARKDPDAALRWLDKQQIAESLSTAYRTEATLGLLARDPRRGLDYLLQNPGALPSGGMNAMIAGVSITDSARAGLLVALVEPRYASIRPAVSQILLASSAATLGIDDLREQTRSLQLANQDVATFLRNHATTLIQGDSANAAAWMQEVMPADQFSQTMATAIRQWTERDFNAAATFIGKMERGPARDRSMQAFAETVVWMEPESAATWAAEIEDPTIRQAACQAVGRVWIRKDRESARQWMERQGLQAPSTPNPEPQKH